MGKKKAAASIDTETVYRAALQDVHTYLYSVNALDDGRALEHVRYALGLLRKRFAAHKLRHTDYPEQLIMSVALGTMFESPPLDGDYSIYSRIGEHIHAYAYLALESAYRHNLAMLEDELRCAPKNRTLKELIRCANTRVAQHGNPQFIEDRDLLLDDDLHVPYVAKQSNGSPC